jgi:ppGpp synthetase/RelA/SpoT-type nucleotidyltranferase
MELINQFIEDYKSKLNYYDMAARLGAKLLEEALRSSGIRAMVTSRAKNPSRLKVKVEQRSRKRGVPYQTMTEIYEDIADLSGVRVSLYFPGDREKADKVINTLFSVRETRSFPNESKPPTYNKRFSGYWANHYRVQMREEQLDARQKKYAQVRLEIQVASVLMHAWSEVEHDLIYKPLKGALSEEELSILDELNGLVLSGEIALERLQAAGDKRIQSTTAAFSNQYDLASYLYNYLNNSPPSSDIKVRMGNVELLFRLLNRLKLDSVQDLGQILKSLRLQNDRRTVCQQLTDRILSGNSKRYALYLELHPLSENMPEERKQALEHFIDLWIALESFLNRLIRRRSPKSRGNALQTACVKRIKVFSGEDLEIFSRLLGIRNYLIHGIEIPGTDQLNHMCDELVHLMDQLPQL